MTDSKMKLSVIYDKTDKSDAIAWSMEYIEEKKKGYIINLHKDKMNIMDLVKKTEWTLLNMNIIDYVYDPQHHFMYIFEIIGYYDSTTFINLQKYQISEGFYDAKLVSEEQFDFANIKQHER